MHDILVGLFSLFFVLVLVLPERNAPWPGATTWTQVGIMVMYYVGTFSTMCWVFQWLNTVH